VLLLSGRRFSAAGSTTLEARDGPGGRLLFLRSIGPGPFLFLVPHAAVTRTEGHLARVVFGCDAPEPLGPLRRGTRPLSGCVVVESLSDLPGSWLWERPAPDEALADLGTRRDGLLDPLGFHDREAEDGGQDFRWSSPRASVLWFPLAAFRPNALRIRWRAPGVRPVPCTITFGAGGAVEAEAPGGRFLETEIRLPPGVSEALCAGEMRRIEFACPASSAVGDDRLLGVAIDRLRLRSGS
jgi:hypothetical protein